MRGARRVVLVALFVALLIVVGGAASRVAAQPSDAPRERSLTLTWKAPATCARGDDVERAVDRLLGGAVAPQEKRLTARGVVEPTPYGLRLTLTTTRAGGGVAGERILQAPTCDALIDAAAIVLALAIDPTSAAKVAAAAASTPSPSATALAPIVDAGPAHTENAIAPPDAAPPGANEPVDAAPPVDAANEKASEPADAGAPPVPNAPGDAGPPEEPTHFAVGLGAGGDLAALPHLAAALGASFAFTSGPLRLALDATYLPESEVDAANRPPRGARIWLFAAGARACYLALESTIEIGPCALVEGGVLHGSTFGVRSTGSGSAPWVALGGGGFAAVRLTHAVALRLTLDGIAPLVRTEFVVGGLGVVHRPPAVDGRGLLGAEVRF